MLSFRKSIAALFTRRKQKSGGEAGYTLSDTGGGFRSMGTSHVTPGWALQNCATVSTCANAVARGLAELEIDVADSQMAEIINRPNLFQNRYDFIHGLVVDTLIYGNAFILILRNNGRIIGLAPCDPDNVSVALSEDRMHVVYAIKSDDTEYTEADIIHIRDGGGHEILAESRVTSLAPRIAAMYEADRLMLDTFQHGDTTTTVLKVNSPIGREAGSELLREISAQTAGRGRGGTIMLQDAELDRIQAMTPANADLRALRSDLIREIASGFGVPPFIAGGAGDTKYANVSARLSAMYRDCYAPLIACIEGALSRGLGSDVKFDVSGLLAGDLPTQIQSVVMASAGAVITPNEARKILSYPELEGEAANTLAAAGVAPALAPAPHSRDGEFPTDDGVLDNNDGVTE